MTITMHCLASGGAFKQVKILFFKKKRIYKEDISIYSEGTWIVKEEEEDAGSSLATGD